jgi:HK97 family phage prohead protease
MSEITEAESERTVFTRVFPVEFAQEGDGRTLEARIVPYNVSATVSDPPYFHPYQEMFVPGAFERQLSAANRVEVFLNFEHGQTPSDIIGHGIALEERDDALYGKFRIHDDATGNKALLLVNEGVLTGLSAEFYGKTSRMVEGVRQRVKAHLDKVSLCRSGIAAYKDAEVLAVRTEAVQFEPVALAPEVSQRLERIGFEPLARRTVVTSPWDDSPEQFEDEQWQMSCVLDRGTTVEGKARYALPVLEPNGDLNLNALHTAASKIGQVFSGDKPAAARKLVRYYRMAGETPPASLLSAASR